MHSQGLKSVEHVLVAPWGLPEGWAEVEYIFDGQKTKSKSSLKPLVEGLKPNMVILVVVDTAVRKEFKDYDDLCQ